MFPHLASCVETDYKRAMKAQRIAARDWPRLFVALMALTCMLIRGAMPLPAQATQVAGIDTGLKALGATLCHTDRTPDQPSPGGPPACEHCPVCAFAFDGHATLPDHPTPPEFPVLAGGAVPAGFNTDASPRGPPRRAHNPTGPPATL